MSSSPREISELELTSAIELLHDLLPEDQLRVYSMRHSPATVYTTVATLWMLTLQRLGGGKSLEKTVKQTLSGHRDILPDNKRVREGTLSENSSAFGEARHRLTIEHTENFLDGVAESIINSCQICWAIARHSSSTAPLSSSPRPANGEKSIRRQGINSEKQSGRS